MRWPRNLTILAVAIFLVANCFAEDSADDNKGTHRLRVRGRRPNSARTRGTTSSSNASTASLRRNAFTRGRPVPIDSDSDDQTPAGSIQSKVSTRVRANHRLGTPAKSDSSDSNKKVVCYYTNWSQYRPKIGKFTPEDIPAELCTHLIFAFGWMKKGKLSSFETNDETKDGKVGLYDKINNLKKVNPKLKTLLAIGGWSFGTQKFKEMSATRYSRQIFVFSAIPFLRERNFDGLDMDWEYPKGSDDKKNFVLLLKELREAFEAEAEETKKPRLLLTAAVPVGPDSIRGGYDVPAVAKYLDIMNIMAYDFHGKWESQTGHNAPLFAPSSDSEWRKQLSVSHAAGMWVKLGAPKEKMVIGMPTYGRSFQLTDKRNHSVNVATKGGGTAGVYTREAGFLAYYEICEMLRGGRARYIWDDEMKVPYLVEDDQWVGFDDERSIRNKMQWIKDEGYAGAMVWTVDMDDFTGKVCGTGVKYPLIGAMREELLGTPRDGGNGKDIDWQKIAGKKGSEAESSIPAAQKIAVSDLLEKVKKNKIKQLPVRPDDDDEEEIDTKSRPAQMMCYVTNWSAKRDGVGRFNIEDIDPKLCTHVVYAFAKLKENKLAPGLDTDIGDEYKEGTYTKLMKLKEKNADIKIMLALGGWAFGSKPFKELTGNIFRMNQFVYDAVEYLREHNFDGLDVDWEYPRGDDDKEAYLNLIREIRMAFEGEAKTSKLARLLLSAAVPASADAINAGYDVPELSKYVDFFNVMTYDFHGQWEKSVGHNSPLFAIESASSAEKKLTVDAGAKEWIKQGAPKEKVLLGMPTYGRTFTLMEAEKFDIGAPAKEGGEAGRYTKEPGFLAYYEICDFLQGDNTTLVWDNEQMVPFAYRSNQWVGFDDERSFKSKMEWLRTEGYGGVMVWSMDLDDFRGSCGGGKFPLIKSMKQELEGYRVGLQYDGPFEGTAGGPGGKKKNALEVTCEEEDGHISYHRDLNDCTKYFMCEGERKHHMPCPHKLVFNSNQNVCDWPENVEGCMHHTEAPPPSK